MEITLYARIKDWLRSEIEAKRYQTGDRIPTEHELMRRFGVSRATVQHAIRELVLEGWLYRVQGSGTFVARPKYRQTLSRLTSFTEDMHLLGLTPSSTLLQFRKEKVEPPVAEALQISSNSVVLRIERLRFANGEPMAINLSFLPQVLVPDDLEPRSLEGQSLYSILESRYGFILSRAEQTLETALADEYAAKLLKVPVGAPLLLVEGVVFLKNGTPIEWVQIRYRGDRYKFQLTATR